MIGDGLGGHDRGQQKAPEINVFLYFVPCPQYIVKKRKKKEKREIEGIYTYIK